MVSFEKTNAPIPEPASKRKVTFGVEGGNGTLTATVGENTITSGAEVEKGKTVLFKARPDKGFMVESWTGITTASPNATEVTHTLTADITVKVTFKKIPSQTFSVTVQAGEHGKVSVNPNLLEGNKAAKDTVLLFTATADDGFVVDKWTIQGGSFEAGSGTEGNTTAKVKVTAAVTVTVSFKAKPAGTVTYKVEHWQQNVTGNDYTKIETDTETKYGKPDENTQAAAKTYEGFTAKAVTQQTIKADGSTLVRIDYDRKEITLTLDLKGGSTTTSLTDGNKLKGRFEADVPAIANPTKAGHTFSVWNPELPAKFPAQDGTYTAQWKINEYPVTFSVEGSGGTLKAADGETEINSGNTVEYGKTVTFTAEPTNAEYSVEKWTISGGTFETGTGTDGSLTAKVKVNATITVTVTFKSVFVPVAYDKLAEYLAGTNSSAADVNYIEVTGLKAEHLKGDASNWPYQPSPLGAILKAAPTKKVALKLGGGITGLTDMQACFFQCKSLVQITAIPKGVQNMKACFFGCENLTKAPEIPKGVTNMHQCFSSCRELTKAPAIPEGVQNMERCFQDCEKLTKVPALPASVTEMEGCFYNCKSLTQAPLLPAGITNLSNCFWGCESLTEPPEIPASVTNMENCFTDCKNLTKAPVIPDGVTNMGYCFSGCASLVEAPEIPANLTGIAGCFSGCASLTKAPPVIPANVTNMHECFRECTSLTKAPAIPDGVTSMTRCFQFCKSLTEPPEIPENVTNIVSCFEGCGKIEGVVLKCNYRDSSFVDLFSGCKALKTGSIKVPQGQLQIYKDHANKMKTTEETFGVRVAYAELNAFLAGPNSSAADVNYIEVTGLTKADLEEDSYDSCKLGNKLKAHPAKKVALELPKEVEGLNDISFRACTSLVSVRNIPKSVRRMKNCFSNCTSLKYVSEVPSGITNMIQCFSGCTALTKAPTIPSGITNMQECFSGCTALTSVTLKCNYDPVNVSLEDTFQNCTALGEKSIKVPQAYYGNYTTADALNKMAVPGTDDEEKRKKFEGV